MRPCLATLLLGVLVACSSSTGGAAGPAAPPRAPVVEPSEAPAPLLPASCSLPSGGADQPRSGILVRWSITSGVPSPAWVLSEDQGNNLLVLLGRRSQRAASGPSDRLGDYFVTASGKSAATLRRSGIPREFWIRGRQGPVSVFLASTMPCRQS